MSTARHAWTFFRAGGFDQVRLDSAADLLALEQLDQKLWVALSVPLQGVEFDRRTLELLDSDGDGHLRAPELLAAVRWCAERLRDPHVLEQRLPGVPLAAIRDDDALGARIVAAARDVLADLGRDDGLISVAEASEAAQRLALRDLQAWESLAVLPLGDATEAAWQAFSAVADKVDDWYLRCRLAAYDPRAVQALSANDTVYAALALAPLAADAPALEALPLAQVEPGAALPLLAGVNPAWQARVAALQAHVVVPLLGPRSALGEDDWRTLRARLAPYADWLAARPDARSVRDGLGELELLARSVRDLLSLANNFVAFRDFYTRQGPAMFQVGTLYLDGRSCELCVAVNDPARHAALASLSRICLVYCDCVRGEQHMRIAAAFTAGDSDQLMAGRNGVFYDRAGHDWDATVTRIVDHPISMRQAFWSPYKQAARLFSQQLHKVASSKAKDAPGQLASAAGKVAAKAIEPSAVSDTAPAAAPFDVAKFAGIFAAIGLAIGAIGTAVASVLTGLLALRWWQLPLALLGALLLVSGPAVVLAWFKLRSRNLGPILDANGWAINARARINIPFGGSLTQLAQLPPGAARALRDPYAEKRRPWWFWLLLLIALVVLAWYWLLQRT